MITLYIGNKNYSSWSLRPWLVLRWSGLAFEEQLIRLDQPGYGQGQIAEVLAVSPTGLVPALKAGNLQLWDSLAISEWVAEQAPAAQLWPADSDTRALARAATAQMHSGFAAMRRDLSMNIRRRCKPELPPAAREDLARVEALWNALRARHAHLGPYLCGQRSIADAFYTPVATRMRSYGVELGPVAAAYRDLLLSDADFQAWEADCLPASWDASGYSVIDGMYPGTDL